jgi:hypothetical protein
MTKVLTLPSSKAQTSASDVTLEQLAAEIKQEHAAAESTMRDSLLHAREAGKKLIGVKRQLAHGEFMPWVEQQCGFSHSTANLYMTIARNWDEVLFGNSQRVQNISLHQASALLRSRGETEAYWAKDLHTTSVVKSCNTLMTELRHFVEQLQGGNLRFDMDEVVADKTVLDSSDLEKLRSWFVNLRYETDKCLEVLRLRLNTVQHIRWSDEGPGLFNCVVDEAPADRA